MSIVWNTKYGARRVRQNPPTLEEAIAAAAGLTDNLDQQAEVAAALMGISTQEVLDQMPKPVPVARNASVVQVPTRSGQTRTFVVERKITRRRPN